MKAVLCAVALLLCSELVSGDKGGRNDVEKWQSQCSPGVHVVSCAVNPCRYASCAVSGAKCRPNYCGGCFTDWMDGDGNLVSACSTGPSGSD